MPQPPISEQKRIVRVGGPGKYSQDLDREQQKIAVMGSDQWWEWKCRKMLAENPDFVKEWAVPGTTPHAGQTPDGRRVLMWGNANRMACDPADSPGVDDRGAARVFFEESCKRAEEKGWPRMRFSGTPEACAIWQQMAPEKGLKIPVEITPHSVDGSPGETVRIEPVGEDVEVRTGPRM